MALSYTVVQGLRAKVGSIRAVTSLTLSRLRWHAVTPPMGNITQHVMVTDKVSVSLSTVTVSNEEIVENSITD